MYPNYDSSVDSDYRMTYSTDNQNTDFDYQFSQNVNQGHMHGYRNERQLEAHLYAPSAPKRHDLGHKFWSFSWNPEPVGPDQFLIAYLKAPEMNVINCGWKISSPNDKVYAIESYDRQLDEWVITLHNTSQNTKQVTFTLIAKEQR
ncbi:hypothetical protein [Bacillus cereus]|uniref:hypothetical protein n=2 Tax=Bacillaceae TaxID=186817 RepID=UPI0011582CCC|nr:hypothetical protein [Bacillus cereus]